MREPMQKKNFKAFNGLRNQTTVTVGHGTIEEGTAMEITVYEIDAVDALDLFKDATLLGPGDDASTLEAFKHRREWLRNYTTLGDLVDDCGANVELQLWQTFLEVNGPFLERVGQSANSEEVIQGLGEVVAAAMAETMTQNPRNNDLNIFAPCSAKGRTSSAQEDTRTASPTPGAGSGTP